MSPGQHRYLRREALIGGGITAALSAAFTVLMFGGQASVPVAGAGGLIFDALPQNFFGALMCVLVPTILTRKRLRQRLIEPAPATIRLGNKLFVRALIIAIAAAVAGTLLAAALLSAGPAAWPLGQVLIGKIAYGAVLGVLVAGLSVRIALSD